MKRIRRFLLFVLLVLLGRGCGCFGFCIGGCHENWMLVGFEMQDFGSISGRGSGRVWWACPGVLSLRKW